MDVVQSRTTTPNRPWVLDQLFPYITARHFTNICNCRVFTTVSSSTDIRAWGTLWSRLGHSTRRRWPRSTSGIRARTNVARCSQNASRFADRAQLVASHPYSQGDGRQSRPGEDSSVHVIEDQASARKSARAKLKAQFVRPLAILRRRNGVPATLSASNIYCPNETIYLQVS